MWKNKRDHYYSFNISYDDRYGGCKPIELFQIKNFKNKDINIIIIYEVNDYEINDPRKDNHRFLAKVSGKYSCGEKGVDIGSHRVVLSGNDLFMLKWNCVTEVSKLGWDISKDFLTFIKGD